MSHLTPNSPLRVLPLGGLGEIGMNCMVLEYEDEILVIDCGLLFSDLDHFGIEFVIPDFTYLKERKEKIKGVIITHGHEDHIGALSFLVKAGITAPIYASPFSTLMIQARLTEEGLLTKVPIQTFKPGERLAFKNFQVDTVSVNHSIVDACALIIDTPVGKVVHTGDFKIDPTPFYGSKIDLNRFKKAGDEGVLLLLSDSTNSERHEHTISENVVYHKFEALFAAAEGLTIVAMFSSNVGRMGQIVELAGKMGKRIALAGRSMEQNVRLAKEAGYLKGIDGLLIPVGEIDQYDRKHVIVLSTGSQGEARSSLLRIAHNEHKDLQIQEGDRVLISSRFIPGNEVAIGRMINQLFKNGADVLYEAVHDIHVSGHATKPELKTMLEATCPKYFIPIHGEYRQLIHHQRIAVEAGVPKENTLIALDGDIIEVAPNQMGVVDRLEEARIYVEGREGYDVTKMVLKERRQMGEKGMVFVLVARNADTGLIMTDPEVILKGIVSEDKEPYFIEEAGKVADQVIHTYEAQLQKNGPEFDLEEELRVQVRRFFNQVMGKKPIVLTIVIDL